MRLSKSNRITRAPDLSLMKRVNYLSALMIVISALMIIINLYYATYQSAIGAGLYFSLIIILLLDYHFKANFTRWARLFLFLTAFTSLYLFYQRGTAGMGVFWPLIIPFLVFTVETPKKALRAMLAFILAILFLFFFKSYSQVDEQLTFSGFITLLAIMITIIGFLYVHNISRLEAEQTVWNEKEKLNVLLNHLTQGLAMIDLDMRVIEVNAKLLEWFPDVKITDKPFCFECLDLVAAQGLCEDCQVKQVLETGKMHERSKLKKTAIGERLFKITVTPVKNQSGEIVAFLESMEDITELRKIESLARENESRFKTLFEQLPGIAVQGYNREGRVLYWNKSSEKFYGYTKAEAIGRRIDELIVPQNQKDIFLKSINEWFQNAMPENSLELELLHKDGHKIMTLTNNILLPNSRGELELFSMDIDLTERLKAEEALKLSDQIVHHALDMLCIAGFDGYFKTLNPSWSRVLGYSTKELLSRPWNDFVHPDDLEATNAMRGILVNGETAFQFTNRYICKDGAVKWLSWNSFPIAEQGVMIGVARDITDMKKIEDQLRQSEERLADLVADLPGFVYRCANDENWTMEFVSSGCKDLTGYEPDDFMANKKLSYNDLICPDWKTEAKAKWDTAIQNKQFCELEYKINHADGGQRWFWERGHAVYNDQGEVAYLNGFIMDITEQKKNREALQKSEARYRLITENSTDVIWVLDVESRKFVYISPSIEQLRGFKVSEALNQSMSESIAPSAAPLVEKQLANDLKRFLEDESRLPTPLLTEIQQPHKDGRLIWVEVSTTIRRNDENKIEIVGISRNIDERKRMENELLKAKDNLERSNATKDKFLSILAHDLRSPFNSLLGLSELLNDNIDVLSEDEIKQSAKMINQAAYNAYTLLENLLEWSRSQRGIMTFNPQNLMLFKEVEHQIHQAADQAVKKQIQFINDIDPLSVIFADQHMLQSILRNLISNGLKFSNPGNHIRIYYQKPTADSLQLIIEDQGIGMDSSKLKQLFSLESKGEKGTGNEPGSGLGLILVKEFMEKHGGNVAVESEQGKGSKFMLNFPISHRCKEIENLKIVHYESEK